MALWAFYGGRGPVGAVEDAGKVVIVVVGVIGRAIGDIVVVIRVVVVVACILQFGKGDERHGTRVADIVDAVEGDGIFQRIQTDFTDNVFFHFQKYKIKRRVLEEGYIYERGVLVDDRTDCIMLQIKELPSL